MCKNADIFLTVAFTTMIIVAMFFTFDPVYTSVKTDKLLHFISFAVLVFPLAWTRRFRLFYLCIVASTFGVVMELAQPFFDRYADLEDWVFNNLGIIFGLVCSILIRKNLKSLKNYTFYDDR